MLVIAHDNSTRRSTAGADILSRRNSRNCQYRQLLRHESKPDCNRKPQHQNSPRNVSYKNYRLPTNCRCRLRTVKWFEFSMDLYLQDASATVDNRRRPLATIGARRQQQKRIPTTTVACRRLLLTCCASVGSLTSGERYPFDRVHMFELSKSQHRGNPNRCYPPRWNVLRTLTRTLKQ